MSASPAAREHAMAKAQRVFAILKSSAEAGLECPTNKQLAERAGYSSTASTADAVSFLEIAGMIRVERVSNARIVTIVATGKATAPRAVLRDRVNSCTERMEAFAEHLANGKTVKAAGAAVGVNQSRAHVYLCRIKARLGAQAI